MGYYKEHFKQAFETRAAWIHEEYPQFKTVGDVLELTPHQLYKIMENRVGQSRTIINFACELGRIKLAEREKMQRAKFIDKLLQDPDCKYPLGDVLAALKNNLESFEANILKVRTERGETRLPGTDVDAEASAQERLTFALSEIDGMLALPPDQIKSALRVLQQNLALGSAAMKKR